ncbi:MAG: type III pantothenate kinase [Gemmatimonadales bacterium]
MLLVVDVGNTEITVGVFDRERLIGSWRLTSATSRTSDEWAAVFTSYLGHAGHSTEEIRAAVVASVAPGVTELVTGGIELATGIRPVSVGPKSELGVILDVDDPMQVGADRIMNTLAAAELYARDTIVVDFGTATTFDCITANGHFLGGVIAPGLQVAADNLTERAAKLPATDLAPPQRVIGRCTEECLRAGILFGSADAVDGTVRRIKAEWPDGGEPYVVATGGLASKIVALAAEIDVTEPHLTLLGLRIAARRLGLGW